jgi:hypothetical protein
MAEPRLACLFAPLCHHASVLFQMRELTDMTRKRVCKIDSKCKLEYDGKDLFFIFKGVKIAKRDFKLKTWVAIQPGWTVTDEPGGGCVEYDGIVRN